MGDLDHLWWEREQRPGSFSARKAGCRCACIDNHYGRGWHGSGKLWVVNGDCPLHAEGLQLPAEQRGDAVPTPDS